VQAASDTMTQFHMPGMSGGLTNVTTQERSTLKLPVQESGSGKLETQSPLFTIASA
jgi:hypothetical protein